MGNVGGGEILVILLVALIFLGPEKLPEVARQVGKVVGEIRKVTSGFQREMQDAMRLIDDAAKEAEAPKPVDAVVVEPPQVEAAPVDAAPLETEPVDASTTEVAGPVAAEPLDAIAIEPVDAVVDEVVVSEAPPIVPASDAVTSEAPPLPLDPAYGGDR